MGLFESLFGQRKQRGKRVSLVYIGRRRGAGQSTNTTYVPRRYKQL